MDGREYHYHTNDLDTVGAGRRAVGVPGSGVGAVVLNVTPVASTASSYVTVWPAGESQPLADDLVFTAPEDGPLRRSLFHRRFWAAARKRPGLRPCGSRSAPYGSRLLDRSWCLADGDRPAGGPRLRGDGPRPLRSPSTWRRGPSHRCP